MGRHGNRYEKGDQAAKRRGTVDARRRRPRLESLVGRTLLALIDSSTFDLQNHQLVSVVFNQQFNSTTGETDAIFSDNYQPTTYSPVETSARSFAAAFDKGGNLIQEIVYRHGAAYQYVNGGGSQTYLGSHVESIGVAFEPDGTGVSDVVYEDGSLYEFLSGGASTLIASNVISASVAIDGKGDLTRDYVTADYNLHETNPSGATTTLGTAVVSSGIAYDLNGGIVRNVVFTDGQAY